MTQTPSIEQPNGDRKFRIWIILWILLIGMLILNLGAAEGSIYRELHPAVVLKILLRYSIKYLPGTHFHSAQDLGLQQAWVEIVWNLRLPRVIAGLLIGMILGMAGVAFQSLLMNPLADPYTTGVASGSALGSILVTTFATDVALSFGGFGATLCAFASGILAVGLVYLLARVNGRVSAQTFLLAGTIVGSFFFALLPLLLIWTYKNDPQRRVDLLSTLFGRLGLVNWSQCLLLSIFCMVGLIWLRADARKLNIMALGEETATHVGVDTEQFKRRVILLGTLLTASTVAVAGIIAFVGFLVPHMARRLVGTNHERLVFAAAMLGGLFVMLADTISRVLLNDIEIGVITSLLGVPFFCLIIRQQMTGHGKR